MHKIATIEAKLNTHETVGILSDIRNAYKNSNYTWARLLDAKMGFNIEWHFRSIALKYAAAYIIQVANLRLGERVVHQSKNRRISND